MSNFSMNSGNMKTEYTKTLSDYVANLTYEDIPEEVRERAKMIALQTIGVSLGSKGTHTEQTAQKLGLALNGGESSAEGNTATCWITGTKLSTANAALVNGTMADILDWPPLCQHHPRVLGCGRGQEEERQGLCHRHCGRL